MLMMKGRGSFLLGSRSQSREAEMTTPVKVVWSSTKDTATTSMVVDVSNRFVDAVAELEMAAETEDLLEEMREREGRRCEFKLEEAVGVEASTRRPVVQNDRGDEKIEADEMTTILNESKALAEDEDEDDDVVVDQVVETITKRKSNKRVLDEEEEEEEETILKPAIETTTTTHLLFGLAPPFVVVSPDPKPKTKRLKKNESELDKIWTFGGAPSFAPIPAASSGVTAIPDSPTETSSNTDDAESFKARQLEDEKEREAFEKSFAESFVWSRLYHV